MKSPITGKEMKRVTEARVWNFRGEQFEYVHTAWLCEDTGEQFTTDESDTACFIQVTNQYREKYGIPYTDEIMATRAKYGLSAAKMSRILGFGINQYRTYEQGEVPSVSNGRIIRSVMNPEVMLDLVENSKNAFKPDEYDRICKKVKSAIPPDDDREITQYETARIFGTSRGSSNGYAPTSLPRLKNVMLRILEKCGDVWLTKMNKLLFFTDFLSYRERGQAITGLSYRAMDYGPVPEHWDRVYSGFPEIRQELRQAIEFNGSILHSDSRIENGVLSDDDIVLVDKVCERFGNRTSREVSHLSHNESAWIKSHPNRGSINFSEAFSLKNI